MAKKVFTDASLQTFIDEIKAYTDSGVESVRTTAITNEQIDAICGTYTDVNTVIDEVEANLSSI